MEDQEGRRQKLLTVRVSRDEMADLKLLARAEDTDVSKLVRRLVRERKRAVAEAR